MIWFEPILLHLGCYLFRILLLGFCWGCSWFWWLARASIPCPSFKSAILLSLTVRDDILVLFFLVEVWELVLTNFLLRFGSSWVCHFYSIWSQPLFLLLLLTAHVNQIRWPHNCIIRIHLLWQHFVVWSLTHITWVRVNDAVTDILTLSETYFYVLLCFTSYLKCDNSYNKHIELGYDLANPRRMRCYNWYHISITLCILFKFIQLYIKV